MISLDPIRPYLPLVYGGIVVLVVAAFAVQHWRIGNLRARLDEKNTALKGYADAQSTNLATIAELQARFTALVDTMRLERDAAIRAQADAQRKVDAINEKYESTKRELDDVYAKSRTAREWGAVGIDADVADRLPGGDRTH